MENNIDNNINNNINVNNFNEKEILDEFQTNFKNGKIEEMLKNFKLLKENNYSIKILNDEKENEDTFEDKTIDIINNNNNNQKNKKKENKIENNNNSNFFHSFMNYFYN